MIREKSRVEETHYEILKSREGATHEELRACYRSQVLNSHPDKSQKNNNSTPLEQKDRFLKVQKAWEILGDSSSRAIYDNDLRASRRDCNVAASEDVSLEEMTVEDSGLEVVELFYQCRCGDYFSVDSLELGKMGYGLLRNENKISFRTCEDDVDEASASSVVVPCGSCSLKIRLLIDPSVCVTVGEFEDSL